jgi:hypothetical protein
MSSIRKYASAAHRKIAKVIGLALISNDSHAWLQVKLLLRVHLSAQERSALAFAAMSSLDKDQRAAVARSTIPNSQIGAPLPTLDDLKDDAAWWTSNADDSELQVYLMACFNALDDQKQRAFKQHIQTREAA